MKNMLGGSDKAVYVSTKCRQKSVRLLLFDDLFHYLRSDWLNVGLPEDAAINIQQLAPVLFKAVRPGPESGLYIPNDGTLEFIMGSYGILHAVRG